jgi:hypothetical protein
VRGYARGPRARCDPNTVSPTPSPPLPAGQRHVPLGGGADGSHGTAATRTPPTIPRRASSSLRPFTDEQLPSMDRTQRSEGRDERTLLSSLAEVCTAPVWPTVRATAPVWATVRATARATAPVWETAQAAAPVWETARATAPGGARDSGWAKDPDSAMGMEMSKDPEWVAGLVTAAGRSGEGDRLRRT